MKLQWKQSVAFTVRVDLQAGWYFTAARTDLPAIPGENDPVNVALYDVTGDEGANAIAYCDFASLREADSFLWELLRKGEGMMTIGEFLRYRDATEVNEVLLLARSLIRDTQFGWSGDDLVVQPKEVCAKITRILGDNYNFDTGE